jgi:hypothetical protein
MNIFVLPVAKNKADSVSPGYYPGLVAKRRLVRKLGCRFERQLG